MSLLPMPFPNPRTYPNHSGVDFPQDRGTPIRASGPGRILRLPYTLAGGYWTTVQYDNGVTLGYAHQDRQVTVVKVGQRVTEGTIIGYVGSLGLRSTGPHLHLTDINNQTYTATMARLDTTRVVGQGTLAGEREDDMPLTKEDITAVAKAVWAHLIQPQDENGNLIDGAYPARGFLASAAASAQAAARETPARVWGHPVQAQDDKGILQRHPDGTPVMWPARGYLGSIAGQVGARIVDVDEKALAAELAPLLTASIGALSDADVARIAKAAADEQARRLAS